MAALTLRGLTRRFEKHDGPAALSGLDLDVNEGEFLVLVGPSGCGKSTALRLIAGLDDPDEGSISIGDRNVIGVPPQDRDVAMVFQGYALYPHLRVREIIEFPLKMRGISKDERRRLAEKTASTLGLGKLLDRRPAELSGGERQRVAMGRAIVRSPKVFLFDEPLSNLDAALRNELRVELCALVRRLGTTAIYVTHDQIEAMTMADRIAVLRAGKLQQVGTPRAIYEDPDHLFVANFMGTPKINQVDLQFEENAYRAKGIVIPAPPGLSIEKASACIRPEHLRIAAPGSVPDGNTIGIGAQILNIEPLGAETYIHLDLEHSVFRVRAPGFAGHSRSEAVQIQFNPEHILWFNSDTGKRERP